MHCCPIRTPCPRSCSWQIPSPGTPTPRRRRPAPDPPPSRSGGSVLSSLSGGTELLGKLLPLVQEMGRDSNARRLLYALRPYLKEERQEKIERALQLARLFQIGRRFLSEWEG